MQGLGEQRFMGAILRFLDAERPARIPLPFCARPENCGESVPEDFVMNMMLTMPTGVVARIVDDTGAIVARPSGPTPLNTQAGFVVQHLRFTPAPDYHYVLQGSLSAALANDALPISRVTRQYYLELLGATNVPLHLDLPLDIQIANSISSAARLQITRGTDGDIAVRIDGHPYRTYRLETSADLQAWTIVSLGSSPDGTLVYVVPSPSTRQFYRVIAEP